MATKTKRTRIDNETTNTAVENTKSKKSKMKASKRELSSQWNVDDYRTEYESDEHWELRRSFMEAHKDRFEEERLVCLAQTFVNMEFMGCKYPSETMLLVAELSKDVAEEFREKRAQRLQRTFVSASDAAEQRAKGRTNVQKQQENTTTTARKTTQNWMRGSSPTHRLTGEPLNLFEDLRFGNLVIYLAGGRNCLRNACATCKLTYEERVGEPSIELGVSASVLLNNEVISTAYGENLKQAKLTAFTQALLFLQSNCYSIKLNATRETIKVEKTKNGVNINVTNQSADALIEAKLDETNKGYRIMRRMGWTGGGLGRLKQGREEPVGYLLKSNRTGLGASESNVGNYRRLIKNYVQSDDMRDMQFEPTFSKQERAQFHQIASQYGLRSASYGVGENRRLLVTKKIASDVILSEVLIRRNPKFCERYFVQVPMKKAHLFPGHVAGLDLEMD